MAFSVAATTTNKIENYTTPGDVTQPGSDVSVMVLPTSRV